MLTNPAGMSFLEGTQILVGLQVLYGNMPFSVRSGTSPALPANSAWRFGLGVKSEPHPGFGWGVGFEYAYGSTLEVDIESDTPVALGGRGDLVGTYEETGMFFINGNLEWRF